MPKVFELRDDYVIAQSQWSRQSGVNKYRFVILENGKLHASKFMYNSEVAAEDAGEKYLAK